MNARWTKITMPVALPKRQPTQFHFFQKRYPFVKAVCVINALLLLSNCRMLKLESYLRGAQHESNKYGELNRRDLQIAGKTMDARGNEDIMMRLESEADKGDPTISRKKVMMVFEKMHGGNLINKGYLKYILEKSKKSSLSSIDTLYGVAYPTKDWTDADPFITVSTLKRIFNIYIAHTNVSFSFRLLEIFTVNSTRCFLFFKSTGSHHVYIFNGDFLNKGDSNLKVLIP